MKWCAFMYNSENLYLPVVGSLQTSSVEFANCSTVKWKRSGLDIKNDARIITILSLPISKRIIKIDLNLTDPNEYRYQQNRLLPLFDLRLTLTLDLILDYQTTSMYRHCCQCKTCRLNRRLFNKIISQKLINSTHFILFLHETWSDLSCKRPRRTAKWSSLTSSWWKVCKIW